MAEPRRVAKKVDLESVEARLAAIEKELQQFRAVTKGLTEAVKGGEKSGWNQFLYMAGFAGMVAGMGLAVADFGVYGLIVFILGVMVSMIERFTR